MRAIWRSKCEYNKQVSDGNDDDDGGRISSGATIRHRLASLAGVVLSGDRKKYNSLTRKSVLKQSKLSQVLSNSIF